jgi:hypothetical protein
MKATNYKELEPYYNEDIWAKKNMDNHKLTYLLKMVNSIPLNIFGFY